MDATFSNDKSKVLVALKFDESSKNLLESVRSLCQRTSMSFRLVHVVHDYASPNYFYPDYFGTHEISELMRQENDMAILDAERQIKELLDSSGFSGKRQSKVVLSKDESAALLAESHDASLLALAVEEHRYELIPRGLSIVLSLLASSTVPLLIIRDGGPFDFSGRYRMLIADDLSVSSLSAVWSGLAFGVATGAGTILHAHILPPHVRRFADRFHMQDDKLGEGGYMERMERAVETSLRSRSGIERRREDLEKAVCSYRTHVASGKVSENLEILARDFRPDIIVMGRSASARALTPRLGRLALNTALSKCRALLLVPPA